MTDMIANIVHDKINVRYTGIHRGSFEAFMKNKGGHKLKNGSYNLTLSPIIALWAMENTELQPSDKALLQPIIDAIARYKEGLTHVPFIMDGRTDMLELYGYQPKIRPYDHQRKAINLMVALQHMGLFLDCGTGKTGTSLLFLDFIKKHILKRPIKALVVGKLMSLFSGWKDDCSKFTDLECEVLWEPTNTETKVLSKEPLTAAGIATFFPNDTFVPAGTKSAGHRKITHFYDLKTFQPVYLARRKDFKPKKHGTIKLQWKIDVDGNPITGTVMKMQTQTTNLKRKSLSQRIAETPAEVCVINHDGARIFEEDLAKVPWDVVILDESTVIKSHTSKLFSIMCHISDRVPYRFILTGTPASNTPAELWSQMFFLDRGLTLGDQYYVFMNKHFQRTNKKMGLREFTEYVPTDLTKSWVRSRLEGRHYRVLLRDCADLPPLTVQVKDVFPTPEQKRAYAQMNEALLAEIKGHRIEATTALVKLSKLRQITGGFVFDNEGTPVALTQNPKMDAFMEFIEDLLEQGEQVVVFAVYTEEIKTLLEKIPSSVGIFGGISDKQRFANVDDFLSGKARVIVCQPQSAGHALTFVNARYLLFYSIDYSAELNYQAIKRIERITQKRAMFVYYFLMKGTIDKTIYRVLQRKITSQSDLIDGLGEATGETDEQLIIDAYIKENSDA